VVYFFIVLGLLCLFFLFCLFFFDKDLRDAAAADAAREVRDADLDFCFIGCSCDSSIIFLIIFGSRCDNRATNSGLVPERDSPSSLRIFKI